MVDFAKYLNQPPRPPPRVPQLVIGITGHRPHRLPDRDTGYQWNNPTRVALRERVTDETRRLADLAPVAVEIVHTMGDGRVDVRVVPSGVGALNYLSGVPLAVALSPLRVGDRGVVRFKDGDRRRPLAEPIDRTRAQHLDSYLRRVAWALQWVEEVEVIGSLAPVRAERWRSIPVLGMTGCALGTDTDVAGVWRRMGVPYVAVVPFAGQDARWPPESRRVYEKVLACAAGVVVVTTTPLASVQEVVGALHARNEFLCCAIDHLIAVYDGTSGGTRSALSYWNRVHLHQHLTRIDPRELVVQAATPLP